MERRLDYDNLYYNPIFKDKEIADHWATMTALAAASEAGQKEVVKLLTSRMQRVQLSTNPGKQRD